MNRPTSLISTLLGTVAAVAAIGASGAHAASIAYVGADGNVHLVSPDGQRKLQVTHDATADSKYRSPSQTDSGRVVGIRPNPSSAISMAMFFDREGNQVDAWNLPASGLGLRFSPLSGGQIAPDGNGGAMVYDYFHADGPPTYFNEPRVGFVAGGGLTNPCTINCHAGYLRPRWLPGTPYAGFIEAGFGQVVVQSPNGVKSWLSLNNSSAADLETFDVARSGGLLVVELTADGVPPQGQQELAGFEFYSFNGVASDAPQIEFICGASGVAPAIAAPRFSPDGSMVAWEGAEGVYVAPTPQRTPGGVCNLDASLVAPGGTEPDWGTVDVPAPPNQGGGGGGGKITPDEPKQPVGEAVKKGLVVTLRCPEACTAKVSATVNKRTAKAYGLGKRATVVAKGTGKAGSAGTVEVELTFTKKAKRKLAKAKKVKLALTAKLALASGSVETVRDKLTLKR